jgi:hypothetical protein
MTASIAAPVGADLGFDRPQTKSRARSRRTGATKQKRTAARLKTGKRERTSPRTSEILRRLLEDDSRRSLTIEDIVSELGPSSLAAIIALPIPFTNMPFAIVIFIIGLGLAEEDGALISLGILLGIALIALLGVAALGILSLFGLGPQL